MPSTTNTAARKRSAARPFSEPFDGSKKSRRFPLIILPVLAVVLALLGGNVATVTPPFTKQHAEPVWETGKSLSFRFPGEIETTRFSPDGRLLLLISVGINPPEAEKANRIELPFHTCLTLFDTNTGKRLWQRYEDSDEIRSPSFSPDGRTLATVDRLDHSGSYMHWVVRLRSAQDGKIYAVLPHSDYGGCGTAFSPDGRTLAVGDFVTDTCGGGIIQLFDLRRKNNLLTPTSKAGSLSGIDCGTVVEVAFSPDGKKLAAEIGGGEGPDAVGVWDFPARRQLFCGEIEGGGSVPLFLNGGRELICSGNRLDLTTRKPQLRKIPPLQYYVSVGVCDEAKNLVLFTRESCFEVWDTRGIRCRLRRAMPASDDGLSFCPAADLLAFKNADGRIEVGRILP